MNYSTMSGQEFIQRYPQGLRGYENIAPQEFMREFPVNNYETITPQEYFQKYAPPETITPEEYFRRYPNAGKPVTNAIGKAGYLLAPLGEAAMFYGAVDAAKRSDDRIPTYSGDMTITPNAGAPILPSIQLDSDGNLSYQLQGGVQQDNYILPPDIQSGSFKAFYQNLKRNPYNTLMNIQETNNSSAGSNL